MKKVIPFFLIIALILGVSQLVKLKAVSGLSEDIELLGGLVELTLVKNTGAAFGMLAGNKVLISVVTTVIIIGIVIYVCKFRNKISWIELVSLSLICGGGLSNLIERTKDGYVVDYINTHLLPVFNTADICVTCGCILLIIAVFFFDEKTHE